MQDYKRISFEQSTSEHHTIFISMRFLKHQRNTHCGFQDFNMNISEKYK